MNEKTAQVLMSGDRSIRDALLVIDDTASGIVLVVDEAGRLRGTVTDGDARRAILRGVSLDEPIASIMNPAPITVGPGTDGQEVRRLLVEMSLKHVPVVDADGRVEDLIHISQLLTVPLAAPDITDREIEAVLDVLRSRDLSLGPKVSEFEAAIAAYAGRRYAIAVNSGTSGLHLVVRSLGLGKGDEVITTPFSFVASSNCLLFEHVTPVFVDIDPVSYNIDPDRIEAAITPRTKAILAVDVFGQPADYDRIEEIAARHGLKVIADCCESIGAEYRGERASKRGVAGVFGFYPNKQITTGEGGAIITDDPSIDELCRSMRNQGRSIHGGWLSHERLGYNYRLPDVNCAIGIVQLERIESILERRARVAATYDRLLAGVEEVQTPRILPSVTRMSWFVYVVKLSQAFSRADRDALSHEMRRRGVAVNQYFQPIHLQSFYAAQFGFKPGDFPITENVADRTIALPFYNDLTEDNARTVVEHLKAGLSMTAAAG
jgi:perosamine synthetase